MELRRQRRGDARSGGSGSDIRRRVSAPAQPCAGMGRCVSAAARTGRVPAEGGVGAATQVSDRRTKQHGGRVRRRRERVAVHLTLLRSSFPCLALLCVRLSTPMSVCVSVTCILSLTIATAPSISSHLQGPFLCPVLAVSVCSTSIGASLDIGWQTIKGTFYAALFGFILFCMTAAQPLLRAHRKTARTGC